MLGQGPSPLLQQVLAREGNPLHKLDLSWNWGRSKGASPQLQVLNLEGTDWRKGGWAALAPAPSRLTPTLQSLRLCSYLSGTAGTAVAVADALQALTGLTLLQAPRIFASVDMEAVTPALMGMVRLQYLNLAQTPMGVEGTADFAKVPWQDRSCLRLQAHLNSWTFGNAASMLRQHQGCEPLTWPKSLALPGCICTAMMLGHRGRSGWCLYCQPFRVCGP